MDTQTNPTQAPQSQEVATATTEEQQATSQTEQTSLDAQNSQKQESQPQAKSSEVAKEEPKQEAFKPEGGLLDIYNKSSEAPIEYHFKDTNGAEVKSETANIIASMAKDLKLTQEQAQQFFANSMGENGAVTKLNVEALKVYNEQWAKDITADPVIGGNNLEQTKANVSRCMEFADDELKGLLKDAGLGNYPPLVRFLNKVGERLGSDTKFIGGDSPSKATSRSENPYSFLDSVYKDFYK